MSINHLSELQTPETKSPSEVGASLENIYKTTWLEPNKVHALSTDISENILASCENNNGDGRIQQNLLAVIKTGNEFFNIVEVCSIDKSNDSKRPNITGGIAVTKHMPGKRAELIDFVDKNEKIEFGRKHQGNDMGATVSGDHFAVCIRPNGEIGIADLGSTNGTKVFEENPTPKHHNEKDPIDNLEFWSVKSSNMKQFLQEWQQDKQ